jgi:integral membrane sensor domain MASE1
MRACQAPYRDAGPMTRSVNIALIVIATICVAIRFIARWRIQDSNIGWDDWTILASYLLLIPSTVILQISSFTVSTLVILD